MNRPWMGFKFTVVLAFLGLYFVHYLSVQGATPDIRFSQNFSSEEILTDGIRRSEFSQQLMVTLGATFHQPGVAFHPTLGTTLDGARFDFFSGRPFGVRKNITAGSKEAIHLSILSACIASNHLARLFVSPSDTNAASSVSTNLIIHKLDAWDDFDQRYPGFGKWLPWMIYQGNRLVPAVNVDSASQTWTNRMPALDNGEFVVGLIQLEGDLRNAGYISLADRVWARIAAMKSNAVAIFVEPGNNLVRGVVHIAHPELPPSHPSQSYSNDAIANYFSNDAYEGELMALFLDLFGTWPVLANREGLWVKRRDAVTFTAGGANVTVQRGFRFSAHEEWGFLQWPYLSIPVVAKVFHNGQIARTWFSSTNGIPGLLAAAHAPLGGNQVLVYEDKPGIPQLGLPDQGANTITNVISAYGASPVILDNMAVGLVWLDTMLDAPKGQTLLGIADSLAVDGSGVAPVVTWDVNGLTALSLIVATRMQEEGEHPLRRHLVRHGVYDRAEMLISNEFAEAFVSISESAVSLALPSSSVPRLLPDFPPVNASTPGDLLSGTPFQGTLQHTSTLPNGALTLFPGSGFLFSECERAGLQSFPVLQFEVRGSGRFNLEIKNQADEIVGQKFGVEIPDTNGEFQLFYCALPPSVFDPSEELALAAISDPSGELTFAVFRLTASPLPNSRLLQWDGLAFVSDPTVPVELLGPNTVFIGEGAENQLGRDYVFAGGILTLPPVSGYIFEFNPLVSLAAKPILTLRARTPGCKIYLEVKNTADVLMTPQKVLVDIPNTEGEFREFSMDFSHVIEHTNATLYVFVFSDPSGSQLEITSARFSSTAPSGNQTLMWDGRRFTQRILPMLPATPFFNLLPYLNFIGKPIDQSFQFVQEGDIHMLPGLGFAFSTLPLQVKEHPLTFVLPERPVFCVLAATYEPSTRIYFELKNSTNRTLFGSPTETYERLRVTFPSTDGVMRLFSFDLSAFTNNSVTPKEVRVVAFADPTHEIRIAGFGFTSEIPPKVPIARIGGDQTQFWITWYEGHLQEASTLVGPWTTITNAANPWFPTNITSQRFWRIISQ